MRRRSGLMGAWLMGAPGLEVRLLTPRSSSQDASHSPYFTCLRHQRHAVRPACPQASAKRFRSVTHNGLWLSGTPAYA